MALLCSTAAFATIKMSDAQMKKMGITVGSVSVTKNTTIGPLIAKIDYDEEKSKSYYLNHEASVIALNTRSGEYVKKGQVLCRIASPELLNAAFELKELRHRYQAIRSNAQKDEILYKEGVISYREYQTSALEASGLHSRIATLESQFAFAGVRAGTDGSLAVVAQKNGIVTDAPIAVAEKITPYEPYFRISDADAMVAVLNISPKQIASIAKGDKVLNKSGQLIGTIVSVSPSVNPLTNSATVIARLRDLSGELRAGTTSGLFVSASKPVTSILIPSSAVIKHQGKSICFIRTPSGFKAQQLAIVGVGKEGVSVSQKGIDRNTKVAVSGLIVLKGAISGLGFE
ncbi:MAG: efflux RND transporter periplasmic adaptor subunit [Campylobacterota bacterium]